MLAYHGFSIVKLMSLSKRISALITDYLNNRNLFVKKN